MAKDRRFTDLNRQTLDSGRKQTGPPGTPKNRALGRRLGRQYPSPETYRATINRISRVRKYGGSGWQAKQRGVAHTRKGKII
jgi:hypothetical protein